MASNRRFGKCEKCGNSGTDLTTGAAESGYELTFFEGRWLGPVCLAEAMDEAADNIRISQDLEGQTFRESVGITK